MCQFPKYMHPIIGLSAFASPHEIRIEITSTKNIFDITEKTLNKLILSMETQQLSVSFISCFRLVLSYLQLRDILLLQRVCKVYQEIICKEDLLWNKLTKSKYPFASGSKKSFFLTNRNPWRKKIPHKTCKLDFW